MKTPYSTLKLLILGIAAFAVGHEVSASGLGAASLSFSYNSGGNYYPNAVIPYGASANSLYQINGCMGGANYNNMYSQQPFYPTAGAPPYVGYPSNYPNVAPPYAPPIMPPMSTVGAVNKPIIRPFTGASSFVPPHVLAANAYNAPMYLPPPVGAGCNICAGAGIQPYPIIPVAGGPYVDNHYGYDNHYGVGGIYSYPGGTIADLRSDYDFSSNLGQVSNTLLGLAPNVYTRVVPQQNIPIDIGPYADDGSRGYNVVPRLAH